MFQKKKFIYCADAGLCSLRIRNFNSMADWGFIVTQSVKKLSGRLKEAVFNDYDYKLLSSDKPVTIEDLKSFDKLDSENKDFYNDRAYKIMNTDKSIRSWTLFKKSTRKTGKQ